MRPPVEINPKTEVTIDPEKFSVWYETATNLLHVKPIGNPKWELGETWPNKEIADSVVRELLKALDVDRPPHIVTHNGREYDLTALETPFGLLPEPVQAALRKWPYGLERYIDGEWIDIDAPVWWKSLTYRAKPAPVEVRVHCQRGLSSFRSDMEFGTCIKRNGEILWDTWEPSE